MCKYMYVCTQWICWSWARGSGMAVASLELKLLNLRPALRHEKQMNKMNKKYWIWIIRFKKASIGCVYRSSVPWMCFFCMFSKQPEVNYRISKTSPSLSLQIIKFKYFACDHYQQHGIISVCSISTLRVSGGASFARLSLALTLKLFAIREESRGDSICCDDGLIVFNELCFGMMMSSGACLWSEVTWHHPSAELQREKVCAWAREREGESVFLSCLIEADLPSFLWRLWEQSSIWTAAVARLRSPHITNFISAGPPAEKLLMCV